MTSESKKSLVSLSAYRASVDARELDINTSMQMQSESGIEMDVGMGTMCAHKPEHHEELSEDCNSMEHIMKFMKKHHFHIIDMVTVLTEEHQKHHRYVYVANYCGLKVLVELDHVKHCGMTYSSSLFSHVKSKHHKIPVEVRNISESEKCQSVAYVCANGVCVYSKADAGDYQVLELVKVKGEKKHHHHKQHSMHYANYTHYDHKEHEIHSHYVPVIKYSDLYMNPHEMNKHILKQCSTIMAHRCHDVRQMLQRVRDGAQFIITQVDHLHKHYLGSLDRLQTSFNDLYGRYEHPTADKYGLRDRMCGVSERLRRCVDSIHPMEQELHYLEEIKETLSKSLSSCNACLESRY